MNILAVIGTFMRHQSLVVILSTVLVHGASAGYVFLTHLLLYFLFVEGDDSSVFPALQLAAFPVSISSHVPIVLDDPINQMALGTNQQILTLDSCHENIRCFSVTGTEQWKINIPKLSAFTCHNGLIYYVIDRVEDENVVHCGPISHFQRIIDHTSHKLLVLPNTMDHFTKYILVKGQRLVVISEAPTIIVYNLASEKIWTTGTVFQSKVNYACFHSDGDLLILNNSKLRKYQLNGAIEKLIKTWTCAGLERAKGVCCSSGITYVGGEDCVYVISIFGE